MEYKIDSVHKTSPVLRVMQNQFEKMPIEATKESVEKHFAGGRREESPDVEAFVLNRGDLEGLVDDVNAIIFGPESHFEFKVHDRTGRVLVKLIDTKTAEVIKEIPPEKLVDMMANLWELVGILVDETA